MKKLVLATTLALALISGAALGEEVNINTADAATLSQQLSGIGPSKAQAIIDYRQQHGPFKSVDDLDKVHGIGKKLVDANRGKMTVGAVKATAAM